MNNPEPSGQKYFPKILFVDDYRPEARVLTDLIRQLFLGYPTERIHWWHCRQTPLYEQPDLRAAKLHSFCMPEKLVPHVRWVGLKSTILEQLWSPFAARHLERTIARVKPDLIWLLLFGWTIPVVERTRFPAGVRIHASLCDMPDTNGVKQVLGAARSQRFVTTSIRLVGRAESISGGGHGMVAEMHLRTGRKDGLVVHSGFEPHHLRALESAGVGPGEAGVIRLAYVGTIVSEKGFLDLLGALEKVRSSFSKKLVLDFYGGRNYQSRPWFNPDWMVEHGVFTDRGLIESLQRSDWGIAVMDPEADDLQYSRFSFPNKVGTYLSAGVPVLGYGNPKSSLIEIMQSHRLGHYSCTTDLNDLEKFLRECLQTPNPRKFFRDDILQCARTEFNAAEMRHRLWQLWGVR